MSGFCRFACLTGQERPFRSLLQIRFSISGRDRFLWYSTICPLCVFGKWRRSRPEGERGLLVMKNILILWQNKKRESAARCGDPQLLFAGIGGLLRDKKEYECSGNGKQAPPHFFWGKKGGKAYGYALIPEGVAPKTAKSGCGSCRGRRSPEHGKPDPNHPPAPAYRRTSCG